MKIVKFSFTAYKSEYLYLVKAETNSAITHEAAIQASLDWKLFPSNKEIRLVNMKSGLVVSLIENEIGGFFLNLFSLHNSSDNSSDYNSTLTHNFQDFNDAIQTFQELVK